MVTTRKNGAELPLSRLILSGLLAATGVALPLMLAPGVPATFRNSLLPWEAAAAVGVLTALGIGARKRPKLRALLGPVLIALMVATASLSMVFHEVPGALHRSNFKVWSPWLAGSGMAVWILAFAVERRLSV